MLQITDLNKRFGDIHAVRDIAFEIGRGEFVGLLGPNGAGKTTTINMITGKFAPDSGSIVIDGRGDASSPDVRRKIGVASQELAFYPELSAETNLRFFGKLYGLSGRGLSGRVKTVLDEVGLWDRRKGENGVLFRWHEAAAEPCYRHGPRPGHSPARRAYRGGRSAIAQRDFRNHPPASRRGRTILYTTHYMEEAQRLCDRVAIIDHGRLLTIDTVDNLLKKHATVSTVTVERKEATQEIETPDPRAVLGDILADPTVESVRVERGNLESVFLSLTGRRLRD